MVALRSAVTVANALDTGTTQMTTMADHRATKRAAAHGMPHLLVLLAVCSGAWAGCTPGAITCYSDYAEPKLIRVMGDPVYTGAVTLEYCAQVCHHPFSLHWGTLRRCVLEVGDRYAETPLAVMLDGVAVI